MTNTDKESLKYVLLGSVVWSLIPSLVVFSSGDSNPVLLMCLWGG